MWVSVEEVDAITGETTDLKTIAMAQAIIEEYVGRTEGEVLNASDIGHLSRATAWQAVYMQGSEDIVYHTSGVKTLNQAGASVSYRDGDSVSPFVAPLAIMACGKVSWKRVRSVRTGSMFDVGVDDYRWETD